MTAGVGTTVVLQGTCADGGNLPKAMTRRAIAKPKPEPIKPREIEPETYTCEGPTSVVEKSDFLLGRCKNCNRSSNSEVDHLCYACHKEEADFDFDEEKKRFVKRRKHGRREKI